MKKILTCPFDLQPEYVDEMSIDAETAIEHKALCVRKLLGSHYTQEELEQYCALYKITTEQFYYTKSACC